MKNKSMIILGSALLLLAGIGVASATGTFSGNGNGGETRLDSLVEEGTITEEQKTAVVEKREAFRSEIQSVPYEERAQVREENREEMKAWMEEEGIDLSQFPQNGPRQGKGMHGGGQSQRNFVDANGDGTCDNQE